MKHDSPQTLTVAELYRRLSHVAARRPETEVVIVTNDPGIPTPTTVSITCAGEGFDWSHGKFLLFPGKPITTKKPRPRKPAGAKISETPPR